MAAHSLGPGPALPPSGWNGGAPAYTRGQLIACLRSGLIALVLLAVLAFLVLF